MSFSSKSTTGGESPVKPPENPPGIPPINPSSANPSPVHPLPANTPLIIPDNLPPDFQDWNRVNVKSYLEANMDKYDLDQEDINLIWDNKVSGRVFVTLTRGELVTSYGLPRGAAASIEFLINALKPTSIQRLTFKVTVKPKKKTFFSWYIHIQEASISHLINKIRIVHPEIDITDATTMVFVTGHDGRDVIADDQNLKDKLEDLARMKSDHITISLETPQRAFTDYTLAMACSLFGLPDDIEKFPPFTLGKHTFDSTTSKALQHLLADLRIRRCTMSVRASNEATRSEFVSPFLVAAASIFPDIVIKPQLIIRGKYGRGPVDFALEARMSGGVLGVTEIKREDINQGVAQNLVQLESSLSGRKRSYSEMNGGETRNDEGELKAFGLVTDSREWWALECAMDMKTRNLSFRMSELTVIDYGDNEMWEKKVEQVFSIIIWLLQQMEVEHVRRRDAQERLI